MTNPDQEQQNRLAQQRREAEQKQGNPGQKQTQKEAKEAPAYQDNPVQNAPPAEPESD